MAKLTFRDELKRIGRLSQMVTAGLCSDVPDGELHREIEYTIYAKVADFEFLKLAFQEDKLEQWKIPLAIDKELRARIRQTNNRKWELTTKSAFGDFRSSNELTVAITQASFKEWKKAACDGYNKTRYHFNTTDPKIKIEVDVFIDKNTGKPSQWIKIDIEVGSLESEVPNLPFKIEQFIVSDSQVMKREEQLQIDLLWSREWAKLDIEK